LWLISLHGVWIGIPVLLLLLVLLRLIILAALIATTATGSFVACPFLCFVTLTLASLATSLFCIL
jgi:hypothetical protein